MFQRFLLGALLAAGMLSPAQAGDQDFQLYNRTGVNLHKVYVAPSNSVDWQADLLEGAVLLNGADVLVEFSPQTSARKWDIRIEDQSGNALEWEDIDLIQASEVILEASGRARIK